MLGIYVLTLVIAIHNIYCYLYKQERYKNWLISIFYIFSSLVLAFRICYYCAVLKIYAELEQFENSFDIRHPFKESYGSILHTTRLIGVFFLSADYIKYALGFF